MSGLLEKRSDVTISTLGPVHNPSGAGVPATSSFVKAKVARELAKKAAASLPPGGGAPSSSPNVGSSAPSSSSLPDQPGGRQQKKEGSSRRNITRKKSDFVVESTHKKQGGHGKSSWNLRSTVISDAHSSLLAAPALDPRDPNYDSEDENLPGYVLTSDGFTAASPPRNSYDPNLRAPYVTAMGPSLTLSEFKIRLGAALREYFEEGDADELRTCVDEWECPEFKWVVVKKSVEMSFDRGDRERELVSRLLSSSYPSFLSTDAVGKGFERLFEHTDSYALDVPAAQGYMTAFLARAVVDEVLPPSFLTDPLVKSLGGGVVTDAVRLLSREHCSVRLEKVWGPGDGRPVADLKVAMDQLLKEFLLSRELDEALCCVRELNSPHFHHELVKRGVKAAMDGSPGDGDAMAALFKFLSDADALSPVQLRKGFDRCHSLLDDFTLDVPTAPQMLRSIVDSCERQGCLGEGYAPPAN
mmetsp:Transcript_6467/g.12394  ORF Transcript_6467/g.12394 Transcript_6467/m.12394 type:complete len:471 (+) Transcript_6467:85-1497(+)